MKRSNYSHGRHCISAALATLALSVSVSVSQVEDDSEIHELTPFTVSASDDVGYYAQETLAGTRLRASIRDLSGSLTIVTEEFLDDLGTSSITEALSFTPSIDVVHGRNDGDETGIQVRFGEGQDNRSIRGFGTSSNSRNFFETLVSQDRYNIQRLTISRGPNAILFGVGAPGGVVDATTKRPLFRRPVREFKFQTDSDSSSRIEADFSQPIVRDKFAVRVNALHEKRNRHRKDDTYDQDRLTLSGIWRPFEHTTVFVTGELYDVEANPVPMTWGFDMGVLSWIAAGKPTVDFVPRNVQWAHSNMQFLDADGNPVMRPDGSGPITSQNDFDPQGVLQTRNNPQLVYMSGLGLANPVYNVHFEGRLVGNVIAGQTGNRVQAPDPFAAYGIDRNANLFPGNRDLPSNIFTGHNWSAFLEQRLAENLHLELATHQAVHHRKRLTWGGQQLIWMDVNRYLPDGSLNPGYMQPYGTGGTDFRRRWEKAEDYRALLAYDLDLSERSPLLGRHSFGALYQYSKREDRRDNYELTNLASPGHGGGFAPNSIGGNHRLNYRTYFVDGQVERPIIGQNEINANLDWANAQGFAPSSSNAGDVPLNFQPRRVVPGVATASDTTSFQFSWHGYWLRNRLVTLFGYRKDSQDIYDMPIERNTFDPDLPLDDLQEVHHYFWDSAMDASKPDAPDTTEKGISRTYGLVYHVSSWLSLTYNRSANFAPVGQANMDVFGNVVTPATGESDDYGIRLSFFDEKLMASLIKFETRESNTNRFDGIPRSEIFNPTRAIVNRLRSTFADVEDFPYFDDYPETFGIDDEGSTATRWYTDAVTKGYELQVIINPNRRWRIALNGSRNETVNDNSLPLTSRWLFEDTEFTGLGTWQMFADELRAVAGIDAAGNPVTPRASTVFEGYDPDDELHRLTAAGEADFLQQRVDLAAAGYRDQKALDGITVVRNGKYAFNAITRYRFPRSHPLGNWSIGGHYQFRSPPIIGYDRVIDQNGDPTILDVNRPFKGDYFHEFGALIRYDRNFQNVRLRVQLNVNNVLNQTSPLPVSLDLDTHGVMVEGNAPNEPTVIRYQLRRPRFFRLTVTLNF